MPDVWGALVAALQLVGDVLTQDADLTGRLGTLGLFWASVGVAALALLSIGLGQSGVLFLNRIRGVRALVSGVLALIYLIALRLLEAVVTWRVALAVTGRPLPLTTILTVFLLALAPHVFNALTFIPYLGLGIGRVLEVWSFLVLLVLLGAAYDLPSWQALLIAGSGWFLMQVLARVLAAPLGWISSRLWSLATGEAVLVTSANILVGAPFVPVPARVGSRPDAAEGSPAPPGGAPGSPASRAGDAP